MKFTIELTEAEVKGIKEYLQEVDGIEKPTKKNIQIEINNFLGAMHAPQEAVSQYIAKYERHGDS